MLYLDSSALVKLVVREPESEALRAFLTAEQERVSSIIAAIEVPLAVRRADESPDALARATSVVDGVDLRPLDAEVMAKAQTGPIIRSLDAIHLATARSFGDELTGFVAYDRRLLDAAEEADLAVLAPGTDEPADGEPPTEEALGPFPRLDPRPEVRQLLANIKREHSRLRDLLAEASSHWGYEDAVYRFWHQSFKVYLIQATTAALAKALRSLAPDERPLNPWFEQMVAEGTGREWSRGDNDRWLEVVRPQLEAFFHARFMVEMAVRYGEELDEPPTMMPSGWAALLSLYGLR